MVFCNCNHASFVKVIFANDKLCGFLHSPHVSQFRRRVYSPNSLFFLLCVHLPLFVPSLSITAPLPDGQLHWELWGLSRPRRAWGLNSSFQIMLSTTVFLLLFFYTPNTQFQTSSLFSVLLNCFSHFSPPNIRAVPHLFILQTLCLSNNRIPSFEGLGMLPNLRILSVNHNLIFDYKFFPFLPSLYVCPMCPFLLLVHGRTGFEPSGQSAHKQWPIPQAGYCCRRERVGTYWQCHTWHIVKNPTTTTTTTKKRLLNIFFIDWTQF